MQFAQHSVSQDRSSGGCWCVWFNSIGDPELTAVWSDPAFDAKQRAVYHVRVIELPTPRWTAYDAKRFGVTMALEVPMTIQERGYTSPIWYTP